MNLAIFDIDGTLTDTNDIDALCYVRAVEEELGIDLTGLDWHDYTFVTDIGITNQMFQQRLGRLPADEEVIRLQSRLLRLLEEAHASNPAAFAPIAGAGETLGWLRRQQDWVVAIATGCWRASAEMKLRAAGLAVEGLAAAFCEDGESREAVVTAAIERSQLAAGVAAFERIVSVGDGVWDVVTAARLQLPFVGVRCDGRLDALQRHGVTHVIPDFRDHEATLRGLREARVPRVPGVQR